MRIIYLMLSCLFISIAVSAQSFSNFGTYTGKMADGKDIKIELKDDGIASMEMDGDSQEVINFTYDPESSKKIRFIFKPSVSDLKSTADALPVSKVQNGLFEKVKGTKWKLQLVEIGEDAPIEFGDDAIVLDFKSN